MTPPTAPSAPATLAQRGFTLLEMALALVVLTLLMSAVVTTMSSQEERKRTAKTREALDQAKDAVIGFALVNGRLPRPASAPTDGTERAACANEADCTGFVPWVALGLQPGDGSDRLLKYSVTPAFANAAFTFSSLPTKSVRTRDTAGNLVYLAGAATCTATSACTPAVLLSQGDGRWGTRFDGQAIPGSWPITTDEYLNHTATAHFISRDRTELDTAPGAEFDDRVIWLPTPVLMGRMVQAGKLP